MKLVPISLALIGTELHGTFRVDLSVWLKHNLLKLYAINRPKFSQNLMLICYHDHETKVPWMSIN